VSDTAFLLLAAFGQLPTLFGYIDYIRSF